MARRSPKAYEEARRRRALTQDRAWRIPDARQFRAWLVRARYMTNPRISQAELAAQCGITMSAVSKIEQGTREPSLEVASMIWRVLHAAYMGRLWVAVQVRRDNRKLAMSPDSALSTELYGSPLPVKMRRLKPDPVRKPGRPPRLAG